MELAKLEIDEYVRDVLPASHAAWGAGRTLEGYTRDLHAVARSIYGRRSFELVGFRAAGAVAVSCKSYERELRCGDRVFRAAGIGAVFTPPDLRGRGYASALLGTLLDARRAAGFDLAYLFSDIHPVFYERLGFSALPSRTISLRAAALDAGRLAIEPIADADWPAIRRCFDALDARRPLAFVRSSAVWNWMRIRQSGHDRAGRIGLCVRGARSATAYVLGRRLPRLDAFDLEEFGYTGDAGFDAIAPLIRSAAGDLRRVTGWLPPDVARRVLPQGTVRRRKNAIAMIVPLSAPARAAWRTHAAALIQDDADRCWSTDHI